MLVSHDVHRAASHTSQEIYAIILSGVDSSGSEPAGVVLAIVSTSYRWETRRCYEPICSLSVGKKTDVCGRRRAKAANL